MKVRMAGLHKVISGNIQDFQLYTCCYNPEKRADTRGSVIHPFSISIAGSTPEDQGLHLEVIKLCFNSYSQQVVTIDSLGLCY